MDNTSLGHRPESRALAELLEALPDALLCVDDRRRVWFQNAAARKIFGSPAEAASDRPATPGSPLAELLDQLKLPPTAATPAVAGQIRSLEARGAGDQRVVWEVSWAGRTLDGERLWIIGLRESSHQQPIQNAVYQAQKRQVIGALAGGIAHDFNNLLAAVIANLDLALTDEALPAGAREFLTRAQASARRGAELNAKLLSFSRHSEARPAPLDLAKVTEEALFILRRGLEKKIHIQFTPPAGLWLAQADENQIVQVLMNLCLNARDAMPQGGTLTLQLANVTFQASEALPPRHTGEFVCVTVSDTGTGMSPEILQRLFEPYFTTKAYGQGAGLSLSIASHVLAEHGGWMEAESRVGQGSQFHVYLPRLRSSGSPAPARALEMSPVPQRALEGTETILLVDDETPIRLVLRAMLEFRGYRILEAASGAEGLEKFQAAAPPVELVLLDVRMPGLDGWETLARLRQLNPRTPVLMLSGGGAEEGGQKVASLGAAGLVAKPFRSQDLLRLVREKLDQAKR